MNSTELQSTDNGRADLMLDSAPNVIVRRSDVDLVTVDRWATALARSSFCPKHLVWATDPEKTLYNCYRVCEQALRWNISPFTAAEESYAVGGRIAYSGKLIASIVNTRAGLVGRLNMRTTAAGGSLAATIVGRFRGCNEDSTVDISFAEAFTSNDQWRKDPKQMLWYAGARKWARRFVPDLVLGIYSEDELQAPAEGEEWRVTPGETMPYADQQKSSESVSQQAPPTAQAPEGQTLQEALAEEQAKVNPVPQVTPGATADVIVLQRLAGELDLLYVALGIPGAPTGTEQRKKIREKLFAKYNVTVARDLTNAMADTMLADVSGMVVKLRQQKENSEKH